MLRFGTAGTPHSAAGTSSESGIIRSAELGLSCMELEWVHGARMGETVARKIKEAAESRDITLSAHGPYYINLNSLEEEKILASRERILHSARTAAWCGVHELVFHAAFYQKMDKRAVYEKVREELSGLAARMKEEGLNVTLRPETTGKPSQFGDLEELLALSSEIEGVLPCVDFAHLHARTGENNTKEEWASMLDRIEEVLGRRGLESMHIHLAGIAYTKAGERHHLNMEEADLDYRGLLEVLKSYGVSGQVICESPNLEGDALLFQETYRRL